MRHNFSKIEFPKLTDTQCIEYWFIRLESWFRLQQIHDETVLFEAIVASLTPQLFDQVVDIIISPPNEEPYQKLKAAIIKKIAYSEYTRVDKLLSSFDCPTWRTTSESSSRGNSTRGCYTRRENSSRVLASSFASNNSRRSLNSPRTSLRIG